MAKTCETCVWAGDGVCEMLRNKVGEISSDFSCGDYKQRADGKEGVMKVEYSTFTGFRLTTAEGSFYVSRDRLIKLGLDEQAKQAMISEITGKPSKEGTMNCELCQYYVAGVDSCVIEACFSQETGNECPDYSPNEKEVKE